MLKLPTINKPCLLLNGDCLELMHQIPDESIDLILCDLPYGTTRNTWDSVIPLDRLWEAYNRICKPNGVVVLTAQTPFDKVLGMSNLKNLRYEWIWVKSVATSFLNAKKSPLKKHENVLVFYRKQPIYNPQMTTGSPYSIANQTGKRKRTNYGEFDNDKRAHVNEGTRYPVDVIEIPSVKGDRGRHPTQKPVALMEYMIRTYTDDGGLVLDNCMGSGTTGVACRNTGRRFIGIEENKEFFNGAWQRMFG